MFGLGMELLMRRAVISQWDNREEPEWPPHPDRLFMALVAAWGESGEDTDGKAALRWLESLGPPALRVSMEFWKRTSYTTYVPVNDHCSPISKKGKTETPLGSLPFGRARNSRYFPAIFPDDPTFYLVWPAVSFDDTYKPAFEQLCGQVTYLGHSSSPVRAWLEMRAIEPNLFPTDGDAPFRLRVFGPGSLEILERRFNRANVDDYAQLSKRIELLGAAAKSARGKQKTELKTKLEEAEALLKKCHGDKVPQTLRPVPSMWQGYGPAKTEGNATIIDGPFDPGLIVLRQVGGRKFALESCGRIAGAVRLTLMSRHGDNPPQWLSGHASDGSPSTVRRPAYLPLGFVGREHADGHLLGVAIAVPRDFPEDQTNLLYELLGRHEGNNPYDIETGIPFLSIKIRNQILDQSIGILDLELDESNERNPKRNLRPSTWCIPVEGSTRWVTVTPLVLPLVPRRALTVEDVIVRACTDAGFPEPIAVRASLAPLLLGVPHTKSFHFDPRSRRPRRPTTHAEIEFAHPVRGPMIIGAGRYAGFGVCRPIRDEEPA
jgi:CRISPR-associated protein Csb2